MEGGVPVYVECKLNVARVRLGHDARDLVELLALNKCKHDEVDRYTRRIIWSCYDNYEGGRSCYDG